MRPRSPCASTCSASSRAWARGRPRRARRRGDSPGAVEDGGRGGHLPRAFAAAVARLGRLAVEPRARAAAASRRRSCRGRPRGRAGAARVRSRLHAQTYAQALYERAGYRRSAALRRGGHRARVDGEAPCLSCASTRCPACGRSWPASAARARAPSSVGRVRRSTPRPTRSSRATRTAPRPRCTRCATAARPTRRLARARGAEPVSGALRRARTTPATDPLAAGRGEPDLFAARPAGGAHEVIVNAPEPVGSLAELGAEQLETAMGVWRERMRAHADAAYVHVIVNEGKEAGASLPHTHAQLYALRSCPPRSRASASASPPTTTARRAATCSRTWSRRRFAAASGSSRWTPRPSRSALRRARPLPRADRAAHAGRALRGRRPAGRAPAARRAAAPGRGSARCRR